MKKLFFGALTSLMLLTTNNLDAAVTAPQMNCQINFYSGSGEYVGSVLVFNVSCCRCASTIDRARAVL